MSEREITLLSAAKLALEALKQLDMKPRNCRAYIRRLEEAIGAYDRERI